MKQLDNLQYKQYPTWVIDCYNKAARHPLPPNTNMQKIKERLKKVNIAYFIGPLKYKIKLLPSPIARAIIDLYLEQDLINWEDRGQKFINNAKTTKYFNNGVYFKIIPNYKNSLFYEEFSEALESSKSLYHILQLWDQLLISITNTCNGFIQDIITHLEEMGEQNDEFKHLYKYMPRITHNSISICIPVLPCYIKIHYNYFKQMAAPYEHWCINLGVCFFLKNLIKNPYDYKELYFKNVVGLISTTSWDVKAYKLLNKALYREAGLVEKYPYSYSAELCLPFVVRLLLFDILEHLQLKILLKLFKGQKLKVTNNSISVVSDKRISVPVNYKDKNNNEQ